MKKTFIAAQALVVALPLLGAEVGSGDEWFQQRLEDDLLHWVVPDWDPVGSNETEVVDPPLRSRDALREFDYFISSAGWTTNQFIGHLIAAATNNMTDAKWADEECRRTAAMALSKLAEINHPVVTNFFCSINTNDIHGLQEITVPAVFRYTKLEPTVMDYLRSLCVMSNRYECAADRVVYEMLDNLGSLPDEDKPSATNRVAKFIYFSAHNIMYPGGHDAEMVRLVPEYSNSVQRLSLMQHTMSATTNSYAHAVYAETAALLSAIPTNELNNISWLTEE